MLHELCDESTPTINAASGISDEVIEEMNRDLLEVQRNELDYTDAELAAMEAAQPITIRTRPEHRDVTDPARDALGQIPPEWAADFLDYVAEHLGTSDRWYVDLQGRIFVTVKLSGGEAEFAGAHVARYLASRGVTRDFRVEMEPAEEPGAYRPYVVVGDARVKIGYAGYVVHCGTAQAAAEWAEEFAWRQAPSVADVAVAVEGKAA